MNSFKNLSLEPALLQALDAIGYHQPTEIQSKTLPILLQNKSIDFHGQAQTGTGKTLAFGLPLLQHIDMADKSTQALVVAPTRELAVQIQQQLTAITNFKKVSIIALYGGIDISAQIRELRKNGAQIIIGTPGRLLDHLERTTISLKSVKTFVLDEADTMLDMGFRDDVETLISYAPASRALWLFSATVKPAIAHMMRKHMNNPVSISVSKQQLTTNNTEQFYVVAQQPKRFSTLCRFIESDKNFYGFIFCQTKATTAQLAIKLQTAGYKAQALHGDMPQTKRNRVIAAFKRKEFSILVATDVAARGIDVPSITHVINYGLPDDQESYVHRIGRTGRAGNEGIAITVIDHRFIYPLKRLAHKFGFNIQELPIPSTDSIIDQKIVSITKELEKLANSQNAVQNHESIKTVIQTFTLEQQRAILEQLVYNKWFNTLIPDNEPQDKFTPHSRTPHRKKRFHNYNRYR